MLPAPQFNVQVGTTAGKVMDAGPLMQAARQSSDRMAQQPRYAPPRPPGNGYGLDPAAAATLQGQFRSALRGNTNRSLGEAGLQFHTINTNEFNRSNAARANAGYQMGQTALNQYAQSAGQKAQRQALLMRTLFGLEG